MDASKDPTSCVRHVVDHRAAASAAMARGCDEPFAARSGNEDGRFAEFVHNHSQGVLMVFLLWQAHLTTHSGVSNVLPGHMAVDFYSGV